MSFLSEAGARQLWEAVKNRLPAGSGTESATDAEVSEMLTEVFGPFGNT